MYSPFDLSGNLGHSLCGPQGRGKEVKETPTFAVTSTTRSRNSSVELPNLGINRESRVLDVVEIASTILCYCVLRVLPLSLKVHRLGRPDLQIGEEPIQAKLNIITLNLKECGEKLGSGFKAHLPWILELQRYHR